MRHLVDRGARIDADAAQAEGLQCAPAVEQRVDEHRERPEEYHRAHRHHRAVRASPYYGLGGQHGCGAADGAPRGDEEPLAPLQP